MGAEDAWGARTQPTAQPTAHQSMPHYLTRLLSVSQEPRLCTEQTVHVTDSRIVGTVSSLAQGRVEPNTCFVSCVPRMSDRGLFWVWVKGEAGSQE